jgi:hypothetical protein
MWIHNHSDPDPIPTLLSKIVKHVPLKISVLRIRIQIQSDPYIIGSSESGSGTSSLKTDHKYKNLEYIMTFLKIWMKS